MRFIPVKLADGGAGVLYLPKLDEKVMYPKAAIRSAREKAAQSRGPYIRNLSALDRVQGQTVHASPVSFFEVPALA